MDTQTAATQAELTCTFFFYLTSDVGYSFAAPVTAGLPAAPRRAELPKCLGPDRTRTGIKFCTDLGKEVLQSERGI